MSPLEDSYPTTAVHEYSKIAKVQEKDLKTNCMKMIEVLQEEMNKCLKESQETKNEQLKEMNKFLKEQKIILGRPRFEDLLSRGI